MSMIFGCLLSKKWYIIPRWDRVGENNKGVLIRFLRFYIYYCNYNILTFIASKNKRISDALEGIRKEYPIESIRDILNGREEVIDE